MDEIQTKLFEKWLLSEIDINKKLLEKYIKHEESNFIKGLCLERIDCLERVFLNFDIIKNSDF